MRCRGFVLNGMDSVGKVENGEGIESGAGEQHCEARRGKCSVRLRNGTEKRCWAMVKLRRDWQRFRNAWYMKRGGFIILAFIGGVIVGINLVVVIAIMMNIDN